MAVRDIRINHEITSPEILLIGSDGEQKGVMLTENALRMAHDAGLDLIEVSPNANPPVCKILDWGKYRYELEKHQKESKKNQSIVKLKEVRMQIKVDIGDLNTKVRFITQFLNEGNKVKVGVRFRGREMQHPEIGEKVLTKVITLLDENCVPYSLEQAPSMEGRMMTMMLSPSKGKSRPKAKESEKESEDNNK